MILEKNLDKKKIRIGIKNHQFTLSLKDDMDLLIQKLGFQANPLSLSYSLWQRTPKAPRNKGVRLVSDVMGPRGASQQLMACDPKNEIIRIPMKKFIDLPSPARGQRSLCLDTKQWAIK